MSDASPFDLRLSSAASWVRCYAYPMMNRRPETAVLETEGDHTVREEGTAMHWAAHSLGSNSVDPVRVGDVAPNGVTITDELLDGAILHLDVLDAHQGATWTLEQPNMPATDIHPACGGTPDAYTAFLQNRPRPLIIVADLKGGFEPVEVFPNYQLFGYASAVTTHLGLQGVECDYKFIITQPRAYHRDGAVREFYTTTSQLEPYWQEMRFAARVAMGDHAHAVAGRQCNNCDARAHCEVAIRAGQRALDIAGEPNIVNLSPLAVDYQLMRLEDAKRIIEANITGMQALGAHMLRKGETLPHYAMQSGSGRLKWLDPDAERAAIAMGDMMGKNLRKPETAVTPTQAAKLLDPALLEAYRTRQRGEVKLVRFDANTAAKAFSHLGVK